MSRRYRRDSQFGPGPQIPLDREQRARFRFLLGAYRAAGRITADTREVGETLCRMLGQDGRLDPSHDTLAEWAKCHVATVKRALSRLRELGLVHWVRRLVRNGWRCEQSSNAYALITSANPVFSCDAQPARAIRLGMSKKDCIEAERVAPEARQAAIEALAAVRARRLRALGLGG
jgi:hypothetical protein